VQQQKIDIAPFLRHLRFVGIRPRSFTGALPDEKVFTVVFPERPGSLMYFLDVFKGINITMFHYRKSGNTKTEVCSICPDLYRRQFFSKIMSVIVCGLLLDPLPHTLLLPAPFPPPCWCVQLLLGMQVAEEQREAFEAQVEEVTENGFDVQLLDEKTQEVFNMFIK
jgi:hypothetical protein